MENLLELEARILAQADMPVDSIHGPDHWRRVAQNGLAIARVNGADPLVIRLFALFHDSRRENDGKDPDHGPRGAVLARSWRGVHFELDDERMEILTFACENHTHLIHHPDPTVGACFDADRLDLTRFGVKMRIDPDFLNTAEAVRIARAGGVLKI